MKTILLASAIALGLSTGAATAATLSNDNVSTTSNPSADMQMAQQFNGVSSFATARSRYVQPSWSNPTGEVVHGQDGAISLFAPSAGGGQ